MDTRIEKIKNTRQFLLAQVAGLSAQQLNTIPAGYNNNIIWNLAHLICAQQSLCYIRSGQAITVEEKYIKQYVTGTRPDGFVEEAEIENIKALLLHAVDQYPNGEPHIFHKVG